jgi:hypothetical protein
MIVRVSLFISFYLFMLCTILHCTINFKHSEFLLDGSILLRRVGRDWCLYLQGNPNELRTLVCSKLLEAFVITLQYTLFHIP